MRSVFSRSCVTNALFGVALGALLAGCGGGGGGSSAAAPVTIPAVTPTPTPAPTATPTLPASQSANVTIGATPQAVAFGTISGGYSGSLTLPAASSGGGSATLSLSASPPAGTASVNSVRRVPKTIGVALTPELYVVLTPAANVTLASSPAFVFSLPSTLYFPAGALTYVGFDDPTSSTGWINLVGPGAATSSTTYTFASNALPLTLKAGVAYVFAWYSTYAVVAPLSTPSPSPTPSPTPSPSPTPTATPTAAAGGGTPLSGPAYGPNSAPGWGPVTVANALQFPVQSGYDGTGYSVAIIGDSYFNQTDLSAYFSYFLIPRTKAVTGNLIDNATLSVSDPEATLDIETVAALAPGANVVLYVVPTLSRSHEVDALNAIVSSNSANIVSMSYSGCESAGTSQSGLDTIFQAGAAAGIAFVAASGDQGNECTALAAQPGVGYPASDPNVIGVGGTATGTTNSLTTLLSTVVYNDTLLVNHAQEASGGGVSTAFALPTYQAGLAGIASGQFRNVPDIAMPAVYDPIYYSGQWELVNGTSWSTPLFAAMLAEVYQYCSTSFKNAVNIPYTVYANSGYGAFVDVTSGNNQYSGATPYYSAQAGYDNTTGIGVPLGMPVARSLCPGRSPASLARMTTQVQLATRRSSSTAYTTDVTPHITGLTDRGQRDENATTGFQLVLLPSSTLASDEAAVIAVLRSAGLTITKTFGNHLVVDAQGPTAAIERLFATRLHDVDQSGSGTHYLPATPITIPSSLAPYVSGVTLDDVVISKHIHDRVTQH